RARHRRRPPPPPRSAARAPGALSRDRVRPRQAAWNRRAELRLVSRARARARARAARPRGRDAPLDAPRGCRAALAAPGLGRPGSADDRAQSAQAGAHSYGPGRRLFGQLARRTTALALPGV